MCLPLEIGVDNVKGHDIPIFIGIGRLVLNKSKRYLYDFYAELYQRSRLHIKTNLHFVITVFSSFLALIIGRLLTTTGRVWDVGDGGECRESLGVGRQNRIVEAKSFHRSATSNPGFNWKISNHHHITIFFFLHFSAELVQSWSSQNEKNT